MKLPNHSYRYKEYLESKTRAAADTRAITSILPNQVALYNASYPCQRIITEAIISGLIINCAMPLSIVENDSFQNFAGFS